MLLQSKFQPDGALKEKLQLLYAVYVHSYKLYMNKTFGLKAGNQSNI